MKGCIGIRIEEQSNGSAQRPREQTHIQDTQQEPQNQSLNCVAAKESFLQLLSRVRLFCDPVFGERSRGWPLGHAGDEGPHLRDDG